MQIRRRERISFLIMAPVTAFLFHYTISPVSLESNVIKMIKMIILRKCSSGRQVHTERLSAKVRRQLVSLDFSSSQLRNLIPAASLACFVSYQFGEIISIKYPAYLADVWKKKHSYSKNQFGCHKRWMSGTHGVLHIVVLLASRCSHWRRSCESIRQPNLDETVKLSC